MLMHKSTTGADLQEPARYAMVL